jgi:hypothetical protein
MISIKNDIFETDRYHVAINFHNEQSKRLQFLIIVLFIKHLKKIIFCSIYSRIILFYSIQEKKNN